jgi:hypothetical protein
MLNNKLCGRSLKKKGYSTPRDLQGIPDLDLTGYYIDFLIKLKKEIVLGFYFGSLFLGTFPFFYLE